MSLSYDVKNKTALVTGANRGIGKAIVESFLNKGAKKVYAAVRTLSSAQPLIDLYGDRVEAIHVDLEQPDSIVAAAQKAKDVEVVVNNAGVLKTAAPLDESAVDTLNHEININVGGLIRMAASICSGVKTKRWRRPWCN